MKNRKKVTTAFLMLTALGMGLASCGGPTENSSSSSEGSSDNSTSEVTAGSSSETSSESSSSSSIAATKHKVEAASTEEVEIKVDATEAKAGDTITVTVRVLNEDKVLSEVLVNGKKDGVTAVTEGSKYTYVMGDEDIKVTAVLADRVYEGHSISINEIEGFSVSFKTESTAESKTISAKKGELVTVIIKVTSDTLRFKELTSNDVTLSISKNEGQHIEETFTMPDQNVALNLVSEAIPTHALSVIASKGMSVSFFYNNQEVTEGIEGKQIQIKITLQEKYVFGKIESMNEDLMLTTVKEGEEYSFIMPSEDASFVATCTQVINKYALTDVQTCGGVTITSGIQKGEQIDEGETVTFSFSYKNENDHNYALSYGAYINNELVMAAIDNNTKTGTISFVMPSKDVTIYVGPFNEPLEAATDTTSQVTLPALNDNYKIFGIKSGHYDQGKDYSYRSMYVYLLAKKEFVVSSVTYWNGYRDVTMNKNSDGSYTFPFSNINKGSSTTVKVDGSIKEMRTISFTDIDKIDIEGDYSAMPEESKVSLVIKPKAGYSLNNTYSPKYVVKSYQYGDKTDTGMTWGWDSSTNTLSFTMPNANLTITLNIVETIALSVANPEALSSYKFTSESYSQTPITSITGGKTAYFWPVAKDGERIEGVYLNDSTTPLTARTSYSYGTYYSFTVPNTGTAVLRIETATLHSFTAESAEAYTVSSVSSNSNAEGDTVSFKLVRKIGYKITKVSLSNGDELSLKAGTNDTYSFTMPAENVSLIVETEKVTTVTLTVSDEKGFDSYTINDAYGSSVKSGSAVNSNEKFTISFTNKNGFSVTSINLSEGTATKEGDTKYSFTTPSSDLTITPIFEESEKHTITIDNEDTDHYSLRSVNDSTNGYHAIDISETIYGYIGHKISITVDSKDNSSKLRYFANAKIVNVATNEEVESTVSTQDDDTIRISFTMPSADVKLTFNILEKQSHQINKGQNADMFKVADSSSGTNELTSFVKGATLYVRLNVTPYQFAYYGKSFKVQYSYVENGKTETKTYSLFSSNTDSWKAISSAPDADITFDLIVTEPTEKVTVSKEDTDKKDMLVLTDESYHDDDFGNSFEFGKGKQLCAKISGASSSDFTGGGKYTITIKNSDTGETVKTLSVASTLSSKYTYFYASSNIIVSLTYTQGN